MGFPQRPAGTFAAYQSYFSTDVTCQKLRNDIIGIMERNVPPETKRSLLKKEVTEFDKLCGEGDPEARVIFQAAMSEHPAEAHAPAAAGPAPVSASSQRAQLASLAVLRARLEGALRLGRAQSPRVGLVGTAFQWLRDLRYVVAASRHDLVRQNHAAGLVRAAGRRQRSDQAAKPAAVRRLRARAGDAQRHRSLVGRGRPGLMLVSNGVRARRVEPFECSCEMESAHRVRGTNIL